MCDICVLSWPRMKLEKCSDRFGISVVEQDHLFYSNDGYYCQFCSMGNAVKSNKKRYIEFEIMAEVSQRL